MNNYEIKKDTLVAKFSENPSEKDYAKIAEIMDGNPAIFYVVFIFEDYQLVITKDMIFKS
jgi:hypothetical protein